MAVQGLGCAETALRREAAEGQGDFGGLGLIVRQEGVLRGPSGFDGLYDGRGTQDYALIAARRGPAPMMFMTRVRL